MAGVLRLLVGLALLPACWGFARAAADSFVVAAGGGFCLESLSLLGGIVAFVVCWFSAPHPVKTYVLGHELTHALWGLLFGAMPHDVRVGASGGSVKLSKSNVAITLAPYFFPFYTFLVILVALGVMAFVRPLPWLPLWLFLVGFTWAFHILFTLETLMQRQPDVTLYGRVFSWTVIFLANVAIVLVWLALVTPLTFSALGGFLLRRMSDAYAGVGSAATFVFNWIVGLCSQTS